MPGSAEKCLPVWRYKALVEVRPRVAQRLAALENQVLDTGPCKFA